MVCFNLHEWLIYMVNGGKYTVRPMDPIGNTPRLNPGPFPVSELLVYQRVSQEPPLFYRESLSRIAFDFHVRLRSGRINPICRTWDMSLSIFGGLDW